MRADVVKVFGSLSGNGYRDVVIPIAEDQIVVSIDLTDPWGRVIAGIVQSNPQILTHSQVYPPNTPAYEVAEYSLRDLISVAREKALSVVAVSSPEVELGSFDKVAVWRRRAIVIPIVKLGDIR